jgi:thiol-disulfide isomerase/thioredoxin
LVLPSPRAAVRLVVAVLVVVVCLVLPAGAQRGDVTAVTPDDLHAVIARHVGTVVVVNFWASWCPPCRTEFPDIMAVDRDYKARGVQVLAVSMNAPDETEDIDGFLQTFQPSFPVYRAADPEDGFYQGVSREWFGELPVTFVVDAAGRTVHFHKTPVTYDELARDLAPLLPRVVAPAR